MGFEATSHKPIKTNKKNKYDLNSNEIRQLQPQTSKPAKAMKTEKKRSKQ